MQFDNAMACRISRGGQVLLSVTGKIQQLFTVLAKFSVGSRSNASVFCHLITDR